MEIYETQSEIAKRKSWLLSLVVIVLVAIGILVILQVLALAATPYLFGVSIEDIMGLMTGDFSSPNGRMAMFFIQGIGSGIGFWLAAYVIAHFIDKADFHWEIQLPRFNLTGASLVLVITVGGMLFNALLVYWNSLLVLPESLSGLEFDPMFFRGVVQPKMRLYTGSAHAGVWVTAIIFSAIHLQFYGFLPRVFLGALFGYLYLYSGSLIYPILAHILNNSITVILVYLSNQEKIDIDLESTDSVSYPAAVLGLLGLLAGIYYFKKINRPNGELDKSI